MIAPILYACSFVPPEWIAAHGLVPERVLPAAPPAAGLLTGRAGVCPFCRWFVEDVCRREGAAGVVLTTVCDQMRRAAEVVARHARAPVFLLDVPATWQTAAVQKLYREELRRLGRWLVRCGGREPGEGELGRVMAIANCQLPISELAIGNRQLAMQRPSPQPSPAAGLEKGSRSVPLALVGGPLREADLALYGLIEQMGGSVVLDGTDNGERGRPRRFEGRAIAEDAFEELADAYFGSIPHPFRRPNTGLYQWLARELPARGVKGIVYHRFVWCDVWHAELARLREWAAGLPGGAGGGVPVLDLDMGDEIDSGDVLNRVPGRLQAFLEMLR